MLVIDDSTPDSVLFPSGHERGLDLSARPNVDGYGYAGVADRFPSDLVIPRSDWQGIIEEMEQQQSRLSDLCTQAGLPAKDQEQTKYCWINAPVYAVECLRVAQNQEMVILSPASAGAQIKGYRNVGGWGKEGLEWIVEHGVCPVSSWPANGIDRRYATTENKALAMRYRVQEWWELRPRNLDQLISCLLRRIPVAVGYNWWGHEVTAIDAVWQSGTVAIRIRNSWGNWGDNGYGILAGNKMLPDDAVAPRVALAS